MSKKVWSLGFVVKVVTLLSQSIQAKEFHLMSRRKKVMRRRMMKVLERRALGRLKIPGGYHPP